MNLVRSTPTLSSALTFLFFAFSFFSCNKHEGPGGTSNIEGVVMGTEFEPAKNEITEIIFTPGVDLEHGDYFVLNAPVGGTYYYIWYDNPTWITDGDPNLAGRTGIAVPFNYSDSNVDIATNTAASISDSTGSDFTIVLNNDVLTLSNNLSGEVPDANNMTTNFEVNIQSQGEDELWGESLPLANAKVYIVYGSDNVYGDEVQTGGDGDFRFSALLKGTYTVYVISQDTIIPTTTFKESVVVMIDKNRETYSVGEIGMIH